VANGERVHSLGYCKDLPITIGDEPFTLDCFGLMLGSYEMVLGVQWLESLGPNYGTSPHASSSSSGMGTGFAGWPRSRRGRAPLMSINEEVLEELLRCFNGVFAMPVGLPLVRPRSHQI
jgi:hypothetical protein